MKSKPYWEMTTAELRKATRQFDDPDYHPAALPLTDEDKAQLKRAATRGRPRVGLGSRRIQVTMEISLLKKADVFARRNRLTRAQLIAKGVQAVLKGAA